MRSIVQCVYNSYGWSSDYDVSSDGSACFINDMLFITWFLLEISYCSYQNSHEKDWIAQDNPHLVLHS